MIVVADTTPLNDLVLLELNGLLQTMYDRILIPSAVLKEMQHPEAPEVVRRLSTSPPLWLDISLPGAMDTTLDKELGAGEREAISLALHVHAPLLLMDDLTARHAAQQRNLRTTGTLGVLSQAAARGLVSLRPTIKKLLAFKFHASGELIERVLRSQTP